MTTQFERHVLKNDNAPSVRFKGQLLAEVQNYFDRAMGSGWSGRTGEQDIFSLYTTTGGNLVCARVMETQWANAHNTYETKVCKTVDEVHEFFGHGRLAQELYDAAGITPFEDVA